MNHSHLLDKSVQWHHFSRTAFKNLSLEDQALFERFGQGPIHPAKYSHIHHSFEAFASENPSAIAAQHLGSSISYGELNYQANRLAGYLIEQGVRPGDNVALFVQRSIPMLVGILGVLKAGAAYVPQDPRITPTVQLRHIIKTARTKVVLTLTELRHLVPVPSNHFSVAIDSFISGANGYAKWTENFVPPTEAERAFVLFTSGTTGLPNGVNVTHSNLCNILLTEPGNLGMAPGMKVSQVLNISFDMAAWETLGALANGATLLIRGKSIARAIEQANVIIATPSVLSRVDPKRCREAKIVAVAGEPCPKSLADVWAKQCTFYNCCGPTETTIVNTMHRHAKNIERISIGKPTPNNTVYILNENRIPVSIGEIGEIWAGGDCVTQGYLGNKALTRQRYKADPFLGGNRKMFRTRDLGRWNSKGELEHFGRTDDQVKIKGFRVELDSISQSLEKISSCEQAVTLKLGSDNLVSFVSPGHVDLNEAKKAVEAVLPYYCTPSLIIAMDVFPQTDRGKIDKRTLTIEAVKRLEEEKC